MNKLKAIYKNKVYEVRSVDFDMRFPTGENGMLALAEDFMTTQSDYIIATLDDVKLITVKDEEGNIYDNG